MKCKKMLMATIAVVMLLTSVIPASANNNTDVNFATVVENGWRHESSDAAQRLKTDDSASYVNYSTRVNGSGATGPHQFEAIIYGCRAYAGTYVDCTSYTWDGLPRTKAIVTKGSVGLVRQDIYEKFGSGAYGQIWGGYSGYTGTAKGCWSVDSVGSYPYYNKLK